MKKQTIESNEDLAFTLKARRKQLGVTQKTLASFCNLSHNGISRIEVADSDVKLSTLLKMSKILGFKVVIEMEQ
jgi:predicted transcriptional regulator